MNVAVNYVRARDYDAALFTGRSTAAFTVDARARALRYNTARARQCPLSLTRYYPPASGRFSPRTDRRCPPPRSFLLPRALLRHPRASSRSRDRDVSAVTRVRITAREYRAGIHPPCRTGRSRITVRMRRGGAARFRGAPGENVRYARRNAEPSRRSRGNGGSRARSLHVARYRVPLSLAVVSASTFPPEFPPRSLGRARPRPSILGRARPCSAPRRRARPHEQWPRSGALTAAITVPRGIIETVRLRSSRPPRRRFDLASRSCPRFTSCDSPDDIDHTHERRKRWLYTSLW